ncbi:hypothetical protein Tco_0975618 [Tanacetum coccineum]|uniref:Uncharacterized protein n=1 Tax=Tanacetum coccineum TaxID=301880 RepID=A0ABQ5EF03_9ASTR
MCLSGRPASHYDMANESFNKYVMEVDISGLHIVKPEHVLSAVANALSVRLVLFNSMGKSWVGLDFSLSNGTDFECMAYALCFPTVTSMSSVANSFAYAAAPLLPCLTRENLPDQPMDDLNLD